MAEWRNSLERISERRERLMAPPPGPAADHQKHIRLIAASNGGKGFPYCALPQAPRSRS